MTVPVSIDGGAVPAFERGVRLRVEDGGDAMLLVPEGALRLNRSAAATLGLVDGVRSLDSIVHELCARFAVDESRARSEVIALLEGLAQRRMLVIA